MFDRVEVNKNLYKGVLDADETYEWDYSLVDPHVFPLVRNYLSRSNPTMSAIRLDVRRKEDYEIRQVNQQLVNWEVSELMTTTLFYRMFFSAYLAGRGYEKTGWKYEPALKIENRDDKGKVTRVKLMRDITNRADAKFVRFNDLLIPNQNEPMLYEQPYIIELIQQPVGEMLDYNKYLEDRGEKPYWNKKFLTQLRESGVNGKLLDYQMDIVTEETSKEEMAFRSAYVAMMCMHTKDGELFYMPLQDDDSVVNETTDSPFWHGHYPYIDFCPFPEDDEYYNVALVDIVGDLQIAATEILNQTLSNIRSINNDMWVAGSAAAQTPDWAFKKRPDGVIRVMGDASQVQQMRTQDNTLSALRMSDAVQSKIERAGGISSLYSSGAPSQNINQTARGAQIIDANIDTNMKMIIDLFGEQVIKRTGEHFLELNAQYMTEEQTFAITGKRNVRELVTIKPEEVSANFIVSVNTEKIQKQTPASRQASLQNLMSILGSQSAQNGVITNVTPIVEALIDSYPEMDNVEDVVTSIDEKSKRDVLMLERGQQPTVLVRDPHEELIVAANVHYEQFEATYPEEIKQAFEDYVQAHLRYIQARAEVQAMSQPVLPTGTPAGNLEAQMGFDPAQGEQQGLPQPAYNLGQIAGGQ